MRGSRSTSIMLLALAAVCLVSVIFSPGLSGFASLDYRCETSEVVRFLRDGLNDAAAGITAAAGNAPPSVERFFIDPMYRAEHERIDSEDRETRCSRYDLKPYDGPPRRIFFGSMIANENWEVLQMNAIEVHDIYYTAVFVEANTTHMANPREMRFYDSKEKDILVHSGMFGEKTTVRFEYWLKDEPELLWMDRESEQRNTILKVWKEAGMTTQDIGLMADIDEILSRDFLRAVQVCDFHELRPGQTCQAPKIVPAAISFETSPYCIKVKEWFHPDMMSGECIEGIGDPTERVVPLRNHKRQWGERSQKYGQRNKDLYPEAVKQSGRYPLFNGPDMRTTHGDRGMPYNFKHRPGEHEDVAYGVAYHFHNWFTDIRSLRFKYLTYAHADQNIMQKTLSQAGADNDVFVRCARGLNNSVNPEAWMDKYYLDGENVKGPRPIFFLNKTYCKERHELVKRLILEDEALYGSSYTADGVWVDNTLKLQKAIAANDQKLAANAKKEESHEKKKRNNKHMHHGNQDRDSSSATVMGMATGLNMGDFQRFVGSLRKTGYRGNIILGLNHNAPQAQLDYLHKRGVTVKFMEYTNCTFEPFFKSQEEMDEFKDKGTLNGLTQCAKPYPDVKIRWIKYPLGRDWLRECQTCTGPVLITDVRDVFFQRDPFGPGTPDIQGLQVFEEHPGITTKHWLVDWPVGDCKGVHMQKPMLCSGTTIGTLDAMMNYLDTMYEEMKRWLADPKCRIKSVADDQSIHNWLFYNGELKDAVAIKHREGVVHTIGFEGSNMLNANMEEAKQKGIDESQVHLQSYPGANGQTWISPEKTDLVTAEGAITNMDGSISPVVHQYDRLGVPFAKWLRKKDFASDDGTNLVIAENVQLPSVQRKVKYVPEIIPPDGHVESRHAAVMGMATGLPLVDVRRFVGSLRNSGFSGKIILGIDERAPGDVLAYLAKRNVTVKILKYTNCTFEPFYKNEEEIKAEGDRRTLHGLTVCAEPYPDVKVRWIKFPLGRDWLRECDTCTGPVLITDVRDVYFQLDPFGPGAPEVTSLQVFEEHPNTTTEHWLVDWPVGGCKGVHLKKPMLCSGTTIGTRNAMMKYLNSMYDEMKVWLADPNCRFKTIADDQSIHNWVFYNGDLEDTVAIRNREGIVHTVGYEADKIFTGHIKKLQDEKNLTYHDAFHTPLPGANDRTWLSPDIYQLTDEDGYFINYDGTRSRVVHQWDRGGEALYSWMIKQDFLQDNI